MLGIILRGIKSVAHVGTVLLGLPALLSLSSATASAAAGERAYRERRSAPAECPDEAAVSAYVEEDVGATAYGPAAVHARGTVLPAADGRYSVELEIELDSASARSKRRLAGDTCEAVSQAAALLVALAIRAQVASPAVPAVPVAPVTPPGKPRSSAHERPFFGAQLLTDLGSLPLATVGLGVAGGIAFSIFRVEPALAYYAHQSGTVADRSALGARFALGTASARVCAPFPSSELWVAPCLGGGLDWIRASGFGASSPRDASTFDLVATAAALVGWDISPMISSHLDIGVAVPLARPAFEVDGAGDVYRRAPVALRGAIGLELHF